MKFGFFPLQRIFKSSAKRVDWTGNFKLGTYLNFNDELKLKKYFKTYLIYYVIHSNKKKRS